MKVIIARWKQRDMKKLSGSSAQGATLLINSIRREGPN